MKIHVHNIDAPHGWKLDHENYFYLQKFVFEQNLTILGYTVASCNILTHSYTDNDIMLTN